MSFVRGNALRAYLLRLQSVLKDDSVVFDDYIGVTAVVDAVVAVIGVSSGCNCSNWAVAVVLVVSVAVVRNIACSNIVRIGRSNIV